MGPIAAAQPSEGSTCAVRCQNNASACAGGLSCPGRVKPRRRGSLARVGRRQVQRHRYAAAEAAPRRRLLRGTRPRFGVAGANPGCGFWGRLRAERCHLERGFATVGRVKHPRPPVLGSDARLGGRAFSFAFSRRSPLSRRFYPALTSFFHEFPPGRRSFALFQRADGIYSRRPLPAGRTACSENRRRNGGGPGGVCSRGVTRPLGSTCALSPPDTATNAALGGWKVSPRGQR